LGSFYKRDGEVIPAKIIDDLGLKGYSVGDAEISVKHAGFIVNKGKATFSDIKTLAEYVEKVVYLKSGITLKREAELIY
jgi:UDP-N-acetylmuramate dehydrogenase